MPAIPSDVKLILPSFSSNQCRSFKKDNHVLTICASPSASWIIWSSDRPLAICSKITIACLRPESWLMFFDFTCCVIHHHSVFVLMTFGTFSSKTSRNKYKKFIFTVRLVSYLGTPFMDILLSQYDRRISPSTFSISSINVKSAESRLLSMLLNNDGSNRIRIPA